MSSFMRKGLALFVTIDILVANWILPLDPSKGDVMIITALAGIIWQLAFLDSPVSQKG